MTEKIPAIKRFWRLLSNYKKEIYQIYLYAIIIGIVNLSQPLGIQAIINFIQVGEFTSSWVILIAIVLIGVVINGGLQILQLREVEEIQKSVFANSSIEFATRLPLIKTKELDKIHAPELVNRFFDTLTIQKGLPKILIDLSLASFQILFGLILLNVYTSYFSIIGIGLLLLLWLTYATTGKKGLESSIKESSFKYKVAHWLEEIANTRKSFKTNYNTTHHIKKTDSISFKYLNAREKHFKTLLEHYFYFVGIKFFVAASFLILGGILVFKGQMNIGQFVASEIIILLISNSVEKIIRIIDTIYDVLTALEKIGYVTDLEMEDEKDLKFNTIDEGIQIEVSNLNFCYDNSPYPILENINFKAEPNSTTIVKGKHNTGKTTLLHVLSALLEVPANKIRYNNQTLENIKRSELYNSISIVLPDTKLFIGTIINNITMGEKIDDVLLTEVLDSVFLNDTVSTLSKGIYTEIDPEGRRLPESAIQKILIARALVTRPKLLLLDNPMSNIDAVEKKAIIEYILNPKRKCTVVVASNDKIWENYQHNTITI